MQISQMIYFYLATVGASFIMETANEFRMFKDVADAGYKIKFVKLSQIQKELVPNGTTNTYVSLLIPLYNIMSVFSRAIEYNNIRPFIIDQLGALGALEKMNEIEKNDYKKKPTAFNSILISMKSEIHPNRGICLSYQDKGKIYFKRDKDDIIILKSTGELSNLPLEEQKEMVNESMIMMVKHIKEKYDDEEDFMSDLRNNKKVDLSSNKDKEKQDDLESKPTSNSKIEELKELRNEIVEQFNVEDKSETGPTLKMKK